MLPQRIETSHVPSETCQVMAFRPVPSVVEGHARFADSCNFTRKAFGPSWLEMHRGEMRSGCNNRHPGGTLRSNHRSLRAIPRRNTVASDWRRIFRNLLRQFSASGWHPEYFARSPLELVENSTRVFWHERQAGQRVAVENGQGQSSEEGRSVSIEIIAAQLRCLSAPSRIATVLTDNRISDGSSHLPKTPFL